MLQVRAFIQDYMSQHFLEKFYFVKYAAVNTGETGTDFFRQTTFCHFHLWLVTEIGSSLISHPHATTSKPDSMCLVLSTVIQCNIRDHRESWLKILN